MCLSFYRDRFWIDDNTLEVEKATTTVKNRHCSWIVEASLRISVKSWSWETVLFVIFDILMIGRFVPRFIHNRHNHHNPENVLACFLFTRTAIRMDDHSFVLLYSVGCGINDYRIDFEAKV